MDCEIVWTELAAADFEAIVTYVAEQNPAAAEKLGQAILAKTELLKTTPLIGAPYPRGSTGQNREIVSGKYRIFYRVHESARRVEILTIWHSARQEPDLPK